MNKFCVLGLKDLKEIAMAIKISIIAHSIKPRENLGALHFHNATLVACKSLEMLNKIAQTCPDEEAI